VKEVCGAEDEGINVFLWEVPVLGRAA
jgi:hypothetical protein